MEIDTTTQTATLQEMQNLLEGNSNDVLMLAGAEQSDAVVPQPTHTVSKNPVRTLANLALFAAIAQFSSCTKSNIEPATKKDGYNF